MADRVAVVGAGYAGLACAAELAAAGRGVDVFEASRTLGGRARAVEIEGIVVDNGAHILVGAYRETLRLMQRVGANADALLQRRPLRLEFPGRFAIAAPRLPAPLHLAWALVMARGLPPSEKLAAIRFMNTLKARHFRLDADISVGDLLEQHRQGPAARRYLWEPLCVAALNTETEKSSAQVFLNVLRDSLAATRADSDLLLPAADFSTLFPEPAAQYIAARGGRVLRGHRVASVMPTDAGYSIDGQGPYRHVVLAVAPYHLARLAAALPGLAALATQVAHLEWEPIVGAYLAYPPHVHLPGPMAGIADGTAQWLFDRGQLCGQYGLIAAVISAHGRHEELTHEALGRRIHEEIAGIVPNLPQPLWTRVIVEKRATFACTPNLARPATATPQAGIWLAGDYVAGDYPATIEGAVRSGVKAARSILETTAGQA